MVNVFITYGGEVHLVGRTGENGTRRVVFDISRWVKAFGPGNAQLLIKKNDREYLGDISVDGDKVYWVVPRAVTASAGDFKVELRYIMGENNIKSQIYDCRIEQGLGDPGPVPPEPEKDWVIKVIEAANSALDSSNKAKESETAAKVSETNAALSEKNAKTSETSAAGYLASTEIAAKNAKNSSDAAKQSEANALNSANAAKIHEDNSKKYSDLAIEANNSAKLHDVSAKGYSESALASKNSAKTSATNALASEQNAKKYEADAKLSADAAKLSETNASTSEDNSKLSENSALDSKNKAEQAYSDFLNQLGTDVPTLVGGKIPMSQIPATATQEIYEIASEAELTGLTAQRGDLGEIVQIVEGVKTIVKSYQLLGNGDPTIRDNWVLWGTSYAVQAGNASTADHANNTNMINGHRIVQMEREQWESAVKDPDTYYLVYDPKAEV